MSARPDGAPRPLEEKPDLVHSRGKSVFIVEMQAPMLKRHFQLSKNARHLYMTMRALADGKTGQLRINGRWLRARAIESAAEMCREIRLGAMRELVAAGLVSYDYEMVDRFIDGRRRVLRGRTRYTVYREAVAPNFGSPSAPKSNVSGYSSPKIIEKPSILLKSISSTVEEIDPQEVSNPPTGGAGRVDGVGGVCQTHQNPEQRKPGARTPSAVSSFAKESKDRRNIEARNAREARELEVKTEAQVGRIPDGRSMLCNMCGLRLPSEEYANHVCPEEKKWGIDTRRREDADALAKGATAASR